MEATEGSGQSLEVEANGLEHERVMEIFEPIKQAILSAPVQPDGLFSRRKPPLKVDLLMSRSITEEDILAIDTTYFEFLRSLRNQQVIPYNSNNKHKSHISLALLRDADPQHHTSESWIAHELRHARAVFSILDITSLSFRFSVSWAKGPVASVRSLSITDNLIHLPDNIVSQLTYQQRMQALFAPISPSHADFKDAHRLYLQETGTATSVEWHPVFMNTYEYSSTA